MVRGNALVRRLSAIETLGAITYICVDKTGTLTQNHMAVKYVYCAGQRVAWPTAPLKVDEQWVWLVRAMALSNDVIQQDQKYLGDPTELALFEAAAQVNVNKFTLAMPRVAELPFDALRKRMTTWHAIDNEFIAFTKGAPERVLEVCVKHWAGAQEFQRGALQSEAEALAAQGLRVMALAARRWSGVPPELDISAELELEFLGFAALLDPPRPEAADAVRMCRAAGIVPVMITGDHPATARAIARDLQILDDDTQILNGDQIARLDGDALARLSLNARVYARVSPAQKLLIVQALQRSHQYVAMTGDGVNDAPALRSANVGVAMGKIGTDVAKEAAHIVLLDDNFASIVRAVAEGRRIYDNLRKFIRFVLSGNTGEVGVLFFAPLLGLPLPLLPAQILWVNLITDGVPGLALTRETAESDAMRRPPRPPDEGILARGAWQHILWVGTLITALCLMGQHWALSHAPAQAQTMVFTILSIAQLFHILAIRRERESMLNAGFFSNGWLWAAVLGTAAIQLATIYLPVFNQLLNTVPLTLTELAACVGVSSLVFWAVELEKFILRVTGWGMPGKAGS